MVWWSPGAGTSRSAGLGRRAPDRGASDRGRAATRLLDPGIGLAVGLAAYVGGYLIKSSTTTELLGLVGDLIYTFGWALWTGVVVVVFLQIIPEAKRRQYKWALDAYEAALREKAGGRKRRSIGGLTAEVPTNQLRTKRSSTPKVRAVGCTYSRECT
jgi:hypothetical protein